MKKAITYVTDNGKTYLIVVKKPQAKRIDLFLYLHVPEDDSDAYITKWDTAAKVGNDTIFEQDVQHVVNDESKFAKAKFSTSIDFKFFSSPGKKSHVKYLEYFLLGLDHTITLTTPQGNSVTF